MLALIWVCIGNEHSCPNLFVMREINKRKTIFPYFLEPRQLPACLSVPLAHSVIEMQLWKTMIFGCKMLWLHRCLLSCLWCQTTIGRCYPEVLEDFFLIPLSLLHFQRCIVLLLLTKELLISCFSFVRQRWDFLKINAILLWRKYLCNWHLSQYLQPR